MYASAMEDRAGSVAFETLRLLLRAWEETDRVPFAEMNADAQVMCYFPSALAADETDAFLERIRLHFEQHRFGLWAVELKDTNEFAGYIGLAVPSFKAHFTPCVEIGWRLAARFWNRGLATEGAAAVLSFAHDNLRLEEVVSFTAAENVASRRVMEKIGMISRSPGAISIIRGYPKTTHCVGTFSIDPNLRVARGAGANHS
jgi:RimJ/RimL family protein N-acetyltransferase